MRVLRPVGLVLLVFGCGDEFSVGSGGATASSGSNASSVSVSTSASSSSPASSASSTAESSTAADATSASSGGGAGGSEPASGTTTGSTASTGSGSSSSGIVVCDADQDGALVDAPGCCTMPGTCDCDDADDDVFPGQMAYFIDPRPAPPLPSLAWDYDCSGATEEQYPFVDNPCPMLGMCAAAGESFRGVMGEYDCGVLGVLTDCAGLLSVCSSQATNLGCH